ncbi:type VI secretion system baseplate subunit TssG [Methylobacterium tarhaniae]|uniref:type VI secretion system baseplate subunit TssG n=1 Tax=Methylobacterium tarhaniae TaxID=1187852 RepID=UPI00069EA5E5|nr:type VI secretion system baseplate subunit TssG [Methylobacterium tarhaniae]
MSGAGEPQTLGERLDAEIDRFDPSEALRLVEAFRAPSRDGAADPPEPALAVGAVTNRHVATALAPPGTFGLDRRGLPEAAFIGVAGPLGPLPPVYTEVALHERRARSPGLAAFLDLFLARATLAFLDADEKYRLPARIARRGIDGGDRITEALRGIAGLMLPAHRGRLATPDSELLPYAGLLGRAVRSAAGLEVLLADRLGLPVRIAPFQVRRLPIAPEEQTRLAGPAPSYGRLGVDAVAGAGILDATSSFRVVLGPVGAAEFAALAPGGPRMAEIVELVRLYADPGLDFDVQVILRKEDVPEAQLGANPPALGWNAWLRQLPAERDADQSVFDPVQDAP